MGSFPSLRLLVLYSSAYKKKKKTPKCKCTPITFSIKIRSIKQCWDLAAMLKCGIWRKLGGGIFNCLGCFKTAATVQNFILMALHADWKHYRRPGVFPLPVPLARSYGCTAWCLKAASSLLHKAWRARRCSDVHLQHRSLSLWALADN